MVSDAQNGIISGTASNVSVSSLSLVIESRHMPPDDLLSHTAEWNRNIMSTYYLDPIQLLPPNPTLTASQQTQVNLQSFAGNCIAGLFFVVYPTGVSTTNNAWLEQMINIGDNNNATVDTQDAGGNSLLGGGSAIPTKMLRTYTAAQQFPNNLLQLKNIYFLPFVKSFTAALAGSMEGGTGWNIRAGEINYLNLNMPAAITNEVQSVALNNTNTGGAYQISFRNNLTQCLSYNTATGTIVSTFNALPTCQRDGLTAAVNKNFGQAGPITFTLSGQYAPNSSIGAQDLITIIPNNLSAASVQESPVTTVSTTGVDGAPANGSYAMYIYGYRWRKSVLIFLIRDTYATM